MNGSITLHYYGITLPIHLRDSFALVPYRDEHVDYIYVDEKDIDSFFQDFGKKIKKGGDKNPFKIIMAGTQMNEFNEIHINTYDVDGYRFYVYGNVKYEAPLLHVFLEMGEVVILQRERNEHFITIGEMEPEVMIPKERLEKLHRKIQKKFPADSYIGADSGVSSIFEEYVSVLFKFMGINEKLTDLIKRKYWKLLLHGFIQSGSNVVDISWELKEFQGDRWLWGYLTDFFLRELTDKNLDEDKITHLHQHYSSKRIQGEISYYIGLGKFIFSKEGRSIGISGYEDVFEAFISSLVTIDKELLTDGNLMYEMDMIDRSKIDEIDRELRELRIEKEDLLADCYIDGELNNEEMENRLGKEYKYILSFFKEKKKRLEQEKAILFNNAELEIHRLLKKNVLVETFINFIYENIEVDIRKSKPARTEINEIGKIFSNDIRKQGIKIYQNKHNDNIIRISFEEYIPRNIAQAIQGESKKKVDHEKESAIREILSSKIDTRGKNVSEIRIKFCEKIIEELHKVGLTENIIQYQRNKKNLSGWPEKERDDFLHLVRQYNLSYTLNPKKIKDSDEIFWVLKYTHNNEQNVITSDRGTKDINHNHFNDIIESLRVKLSES